MFDLVVMVDWSASSTPKTGADSIWIGGLDAATGEVTCENARTRRQAEQRLRDVLVAHPDRRILVGFDIAYAYPSGVAPCVHPRGDWRGVWEHLAGVIEDDERNSNNRFAVAAALNAALGPGPGPFWGCPPSRASSTLDPRRVHAVPIASPGGPILERRLTEQRLLDRRLRPSSTFQLYGNGCVGSQTLVGIPVLHRLVGDPALRDRTEVWPFTTGLVADPTGGRPDTIVHAEVWPSLLPVDRTLHGVKDAAQVIGLCRHLAALDRDGRLSTLFAPPVPSEALARVLREEGWILGVT